MYKLIKIKDTIKKLFPRFINSNRLYYLYSLLKDFDGRQHYIKKTNQIEEKTYYVIRPRSNGVEGLMSILMYVLQRIDYAQRKKWIPIVDMKNFPSQYYDGEKNIWELLFMQLSNSSLEEAYGAKNIILSGYTWKEIVDRRIGAVDCIRDASLFEYSVKLMKNNICFTDIVDNYVVEEEKIIMPNECIGVYVRGTDYVALKPVGEPVQPMAEDVIEKTCQFIEIYSCKRIFLVTEDESIYLKFKSKFGNNLLTCSFDSYVSNYDGKNFLSKSGALDKDKQALCLNYLTKIIILSHCKFFVGSITKGSIAALLFNNNSYYEKYIFDLGNY